MKGLRPLHASPKNHTDFIDNLGAGAKRVCPLSIMKGVPAALEDMGGEERAKWGKQMGKTAGSNKTAAERA